MNNILYELAPDLYLIQGENNGRPPYCNGLFIDSELKVLVDSGFGTKVRNKLLSMGKIDVIINSHFHIDHTYGNHFFPEAEIWAHYLDAMPISYKEVYLAYIGYDKPNDLPNDNFYPKGMAERKVARDLTDGELLTFGNTVLQVIHTPGHSPGHISLFEPNHKILFSGDINLSGLGPWYGHNCCDIDEFLFSIEKIIALNPRILVDSHYGIHTDNLAVKLRNYAAKINEREKLLLANLKAPSTIEELLDLKIVYRHYPEPEIFFRFYERKMLEKHLNRAVAQGKATIKYRDNSEIYYLAT